jgi:hypothetical protein
MRGIRSRGRARLGAVEVRGDRNRGNCWSGSVGNPASADSFEDGRRVEPLLMDGTKVKGRLESLFEDEWISRMDGDEQQHFTVDTIVSARKGGMAGVDHGGHRSGRGGWHLGRDVLTPGGGRHYNAICS